MTGIFAAGDKAPNAIIARLNQEILEFSARIETREQFLKRGVEMVGGTLEPFAVAIRADVDLRVASQRGAKAIGTPAKAGVRKRLNKLNQHRLISRAGVTGLDSRENC